MRRGFTLVETIVALLLVQVGILAVAATGAVAARDAAAAHRVVRARDAARSRLELLRPGVCAGAPAGSVRLSAMEEHWSTRPIGPSRAIRDSVVYALPGGRNGHFVLELVVWCGE